MVHSIIYDPNIDFDKMKERHAGQTNVMATALKVLEEERLRSQDPRRNYSPRKKYL